ncbi:MAG: acyl-CoA dehydrogenase family protein [Pseudomonadota bacterium]|nr:acyl-CoA dehydrogenase family protein [Pseudomonadota bacterium]
MTNPSREELLDRARQLAPLLRERASEAEDNRGISRDTHERFCEAGFYKILQPVRYGGFETDVGLVVDLAVELGRGCGSSAWVFTNLAMHGLTMGMKDPRCQEEVWGGNQDALICSASPAGDSNVTIVDGGLVVDGQWHYSSAVDFADYVHLQIFLRPEDGPPEHRFALVAKADYEIIDDWYSTGMSATGSRSIEMKDVFVPDYRMLSSLNIRGGPTPGSEVNPGVLYKLPFWGLGSKWFAGPAIGLALGALELIEQDLESRIGMGGAKLWAEPTVHGRLAESGGEIEAAWAMLARDCTDVMRMTGAGEDPTLLIRAKWRRNNAYAAVLCTRAVDRLFDLTGMRGMQPGHAVQRAWRDVHAVGRQLGIAWDPQAVNYGRARFDLPFNDPRV